MLGGSVIRVGVLLGGKLGTRAEAKRPTVTNRVGV